MMWYVRFHIESGVRTERKTSSTIYLDTASEQNMAQILRSQSSNYFYLQHYLITKSQIAGYFERQNVWATYSLQTLRGASHCLLLGTNESFGWYHPPPDKSSPSRSPGTQVRQRPVKSSSPHRAHP